MATAGSPVPSPPDHAGQRGATASLPGCFWCPRRRHFPAELEHLRRSRRALGPRLSPSLPLSPALTAVVGETAARQARAAQGLSTEVDPGTGLRNRFSKLRGACSSRGFFRPLPLRSANTCAHPPRDTEERKKRIRSRYWRKDYAGQLCSKT